MSILDKASLIQIPSGYKSTKLYSLRPINGDGDFTFSRSSSGTRVNSEGLIEEMSANVPRLDYSGGATCASLLLENQATNLITYSNDLTQSLWFKNNVSTVLESGGIYNDKNKITINTANNRHIVYQAISKTSANDVFSVYVKKGNTSLVFIQAATDNASTRRGVIFNFDTGTVVNDSIGGAAASYSVDACANGWFRISINGGNSTTVYPVIGFTDSQNPTLNANYEPIFVGNGTDFFYASAFQYEVGTFQTSYIPTDGSTVTRSADVCNNAGTSATFNSTEGVLFAEIAALANDGTYRMISLSDGTATNRISFFYQNSPSNTIAVESAGSGTNLGIYGQSLTITNSNKIAVKYKANDCALWVNGVEVATDTSFAAFSSGTFTELSFDKGDGASLPFYGKCKQLMTFNEALSDEELSDLTGQVNLSFNNLATFYGYTIL